MQLKNKKVLMMGLGLLGGGVSTTNWLLDQGARVTVTDLKDEKTMASSMRKVHEHIKKVSPDGASYDEMLGRLTWALGGHNEKMVRDNVVVMVNPDVPKDSTYVRLAHQLGKAVINEASVFYGLWQGRTIGITGTRGKTTTAHWVGHFLNGHTDAVVTGNSLTNPFFSSLRNNKKSVTAITELPSFLLEHYEDAPDIAVVTNLYRDHLSRYKGIQDYAATKAAIFAQQKPGQHLLLNADDAWTPFFMDRTPKAQVWFTSAHTLKSGQGLYLERGHLWFLNSGMAERVLEIRDFAQKYGEHNLENLMRSVLAAHLAGCPWPVIAERMETVPGIPFRQEVVHQSGKLTIINDTCATSPDGAIAAIKRWGGPNCILLAGGTDRDLEYAAWAEAVKEYIKPENTIFQEGTATSKMVRALKRSARGRRTYATLEKALKASFKRSGKYVHSVVLFSPGAKSFGPFKNEYDRGQQFNKLVKKLT